MLVFADTNTEDPTLYEAMEHMREKALPECDFVWLDNAGRTTWDVFDEFGIIKVDGKCKASLELKHKAIREFVEKHWFPSGVVMVSGLDWTEMDRITEKWNPRWSGYLSWHPMTEPKRLSRCQMIADVKGMGYPDQHLYDRGYPHNNCGGGCVLAGMAQWAGLLKDKPDVYAWNEQREAEFNRRQIDRGKDRFTVLRDRRGGGDKPHSLAEFRERVETGDTTHRDDFRSTCGCMA